MNPFAEALNDHSADLRAIRPLGPISNELSSAETVVPEAPWVHSTDAASIPRLVSSIEAYAELVVELFAEPYSDEIVMYRYNLSQESLDKLHGLWRMRFQADAALAARWRVCRAEAIERYNAG